jgi:hypothetical protein
LAARLVLPDGAGSKRKQNGAPPEEGRKKKKARQPQADVDDDGDEYAEGDDGALHEEHDAEEADDRDLGGDAAGHTAGDGGLQHERFGDGQKVTVHTDGILSSAQFTSLSLSEPTVAVRAADRLRGEVGKASSLTTCRLSPRRCVRWASTA